MEEIHIRLLSLPFTVTHFASAVRLLASPAFLSFRTPSTSRRVMLNTRGPMYFLNSGEFLTLQNLPHCHFLHFSSGNIGQMLEFSFSVPRFHFQFSILCLSVLHPRWFIQADSTTRRSPVISLLSVHPGPPTSQSWCWCSLQWATVAFL